MKRYSHHTDVYGQRVPYSPVRRGDRGAWAVAFPDPKTGKRVRRATPHEARGKAPPPAFHEAAAALIREAYRPQLPPLPVQRGWDELIDEVARTTPHVRPETVRRYRDAAKAVRETLPDFASPLDVTPERVRLFGKLWLAAPPKRKTASGLRSPVSLSTHTRGLSGLTNHLIDLGFLTANPWRAARVPGGEREKKPAPTDADLEMFFGWLRDRYPEWESLRILLTLKAATGCRTADLCQLEAADLRGDTLTFRAATAKTRRGRAVELPTVLAADVRAVAGADWMWERVFADALRFRGRAGRRSLSFRWRSVYWLVAHLFREYREDHPDRPPLTPHGLRRRAVTRGVIALGSTDAAAAALGLSERTARSHYLDTKQAFDAAGSMKRLAEQLVPRNDTKTSPEARSG